MPLTFPNPIEVCIPDWLFVRVKRTLSAVAHVPPTIKRFVWPVPATPFTPPVKSVAVVAICDVNDAILQVREGDRYYITCGAQRARSAGISHRTYKRPRPTLRR